jgi:hypothetical protein
VSDQADLLDSLARQVASLESRIAAYERANLESMLGIGLPGRVGSIGSMPTPPAVGGGPVTPAAVIAPGAIGPGSFAVGAITDLTPFASNIRPILLVTTLPTLPDAAYPVDTFVYKTNDVPPRLYKNVANVWVAAVGPDDIQANSITAGQIAAAAISADEIAAGAITTDKLGLVDAGGTTLLNASGFGPTWRRFIQSGVYNSDFYAPPPTVGNVLNNSTNPLPYWTYTQVSGTKITGQHIDDAGVASGHVVRFTMATAGAAGDKTQLEQYVPISGSLARFSNYQINATFKATADSLAEMFLEVAPVNAALSVVGAGVTTDAVTLTEINATSANVLTVNFTDNGQLPTPADAAFLRIRVGMRRGSAGVNDTGTGYVAEVTVDRMISEIRVPDQSDPTKIGGQIVSGSGVLSLRSQFGSGTAAIIDLNGDSGEVSVPGILESEGLKISPSHDRIDPAGYMPMAFPIGHSSAHAYATALNLDIVSGGNGGARAMPLLLTSRMIAVRWILYNTDTANARSAEVRLYQDVGSNILEFVTGSNATFSFTPGAAARRTADMAVFPVVLQPGVYWAVIRNTSTARSFGIGFTAAAGGLDLKANVSNTTTPALGSTIDIDDWVASAAQIGLFIGGSAAGIGWDIA